jgi:hypothetical protein
MSDPVVCSFFTRDKYYSDHAQKLQINLESLGLTYFLEEVEPDINDDWVDICRKKVSFIHRVCEKYPDRRVIWIDVDCRILELPDFVKDSSADIIGFQRGFSPPIAIGYRNPCKIWNHLNVKPFF